MLQSAQLQNTQCTICKVHSYKVHKSQSAQSASYHKITGDLVYQYVSLDATEQALTSFTPEDGNMFSVRNVVMSEHNSGGHFT
jgi:hypothetical protein